MPDDDETTTGTVHEQLQRCVDQVLAVVDCRPACEVIDAVGRRRYLHAGPALDISAVSPALRGALAGALIFEDEAADIDEALAIIDRGELDLIPCHAASAVGALAGVVSPRTPVFVVERSDGRRTYSPIHEGPGSSIRAGQFDRATVAAMEHLAGHVTSVLSLALRAADPIDPLAIMTSGLGRGDEGHNRNVACSTEMFRRLAPAVCEVAASSTDAAAILRLIGDNVQFFLPTAMAMAKAVADDIHALGIPGLVTAVAANGTELGIRVSGVDQEWFTTAAPIGDIVFYDGFGPGDANPLVGDSPVIETVGLGAFALSAAPNLARSLGVTSAAADSLVSSMRSICVARAERFAVPTDDYEPTGLGIDAAAVVRAGVTPAFSIGYLHRELGRGRVGAGLLHAPMEPFVAATERLPVGTRNE